MFCLTRRLSMFGLSYFFYPWGFIVQILAIVHFLRRRPENYWLYIIFLGGFLGDTVYRGVEVPPDITLLRGAIHGIGPRLCVQTVETQNVDQHSEGSYNELRELYMEEKQYGKA